MKLWIARDTKYTTYFYECDDYGEEQVRGNLHIFYDTPELLYVDGVYNENRKNDNDWYQRSQYYKWQNARLICDIPSYMFPEIKEGECIEFINI